MQGPVGPSRSLATAGVTRMVFDGQVIIVVLSLSHRVAVLTVYSPSEATVRAGAQTGCRPTTRRCCDPQPRVGSRSVEPARVRASWLVSQPHHHLFDSLQARGFEERLPLGHRFH